MTKMFVFNLETFKTIKWIIIIKKIIINIGGDRRSSTQASPRSRLVVNTPKSGLMSPAL